MASHAAFWDAGITEDFRWAEGPKSLQEVREGDVESSEAGFEVGVNWGSTEY